MSDRRAFTLIELLIVIAIIGILSVALVPTGMNALKKSRDMTRKAHVDAITKVVQEYYLDTSSNVLTNDTYKWTFACVGHANTGANLKSEIKSYFKGGNPPLDPSGNNRDFDGAGTVWAYQNCSYFVTAGKNYFAVWAQMESLENGNYDPVAHSNKYPSDYFSSSSLPALVDTDFSPDSSGMYYFVRRGLE